VREWIERVKQWWLGWWKAVIDRFRGPVEVEDAVTVEAAFETALEDAAATEAAEIGVRVGGSLPYIREFPAPALESEDLAWDGRYLWVCDWDMLGLFQIDPVTGVVQREVGLDISMEAITWNGRAVCGASIAGADAIYSIGTDGALTRLCAAPGTDGGTRGLCWDGRHFWTNNLIDWMTYQIDAQGTVLRSFPTPWINPGGMTWAGGYLWSCEMAGLFYRIDPLTGAVTDYIGSPANNPTGLTWDGQSLWSADLGTHTIYQTRVS
jgi:hypothetical protein